MNNKAFSLIELLVVMGIIAVLSALVTYNFNSARARARDLQRKNDVKAVQQALEIYKNDNSQAFPASGTWEELMTALNAGGYITRNFSDPKESLKTGSWVEYRYQRYTALTYDIMVCLENRTDEDATSTNCGPSNAGLYYIVNQP